MRFFDRSKSQRWIIEEDKKALGDRSDRYVVYFPWLYPPDRLKTANDNLQSAYNHKANTRYRRAMRARRNRIRKSLNRTRK